MDLRRHIDTQHGAEHIHDNICLTNKTINQQEYSNNSSVKTTNNGAKYGPIGSLIQELAARH